MSDRSDSVLESDRSDSLQESEDSIYESPCKKGEYNYISVSTSPVGSSHCRVQPNGQETAIEESSNVIPNLPNLSLDYMESHYELWENISISNHSSKLPSSQINPETNWTGYSSKDTISLSDGTVESEKNFPLHCHADCVASDNKDRPIKLKDSLSISLEETCSSNSGLESDRTCELSDSSWESVCQESGKDTTVNKSNTLRLSSTKLDKVESRKLKESCVPSSSLDTVMDITKQVLSSKYAPFPYFSMLYVLPFPTAHCPTRSLPLLLPPLLHAPCSLSLLLPAPQTPFFHCYLHPLLPAPRSLPLIAPHAPFFMFLHCYLFPWTTGQQN